jgi:hypothetical protein
MSLKHLSACFLLQATILVAVAICVLAGSTLYRPGNGTEPRYRLCACICLIGRICSCGVRLT